MATTNLLALQKQSIPLQKEPRQRHDWTDLQKFIFRVTFVFFLLLCIPAYTNFYTHIFNIELSKITYHDLQSIVAFWPPQYILIESEEGVFGIFNYINLILSLGIGLLVALVWTLADKKSVSYDKWYYWIRVLVRYRLAYGMVGWGLKKVFPMQMVFPPIGMLNTSFADMAEKKLYWSHVGISFNYTVFLGLAEFIPGLLLLHRKTASLGGFLATIVCTNICIANHSYDAGVAVPAAYFALLGIFVSWQDLTKAWHLLVNGKNIEPYRYYPSFTQKWPVNLRLGLKIVFNAIFVVGATALWGYGFFNGNNYNIPSTPGLKNTEGYYNVSEFRLNNKLLPYSPTDTVRWQDAAFEKWSSLSFKTNKPALIDRMIGYSPLRVKGDKGDNIYNQQNTQISDELFKLKKNRDLGVTRWEVGGMSGKRKYFFYEADTASHVLLLQNKNREYKNEKQILKYTINPSDRSIFLVGKNEYNDSISVLLKLINKKYPLVEGRRGTNQVY